MCGICGIFNTSLEPLDYGERIDRMSERLVHRGPDSHGKFELPYLSLAIRRLSIIDLETGDQPLANETGDIVVVFNGEIYNFSELRRSLEGRGHRFQTRSDGEVIVHLYEELGPAFARELNGMFAIALWDGMRGRLLLARDRAGEKPLYYWLRNHTLVFASEIKAILEYPLVSREIDPSAVPQYLFYGYIPSPRSIFAEIRRLPAGHTMMVEGGEIRIEPFWRLKDYLRPPGLSSVSRREQAKLIQELRDRLRKAAISRLVSDVPLGVFLSGGVDSSTLVALMSELNPGRVNSFSVAFAEKSFNEEHYSTLVARHFHTRHHVFAAGEVELEEGLQAMAEHLDEPIADPAVLPTFLLSRFARPYIKVALSGEGSDELFGGYPTYLGSRLAPYYLRLPIALRRPLAKCLPGLLPVSSNAVPVELFLRRFLSYAEWDPGQRHQIWFGIFSPSEIDRILETGNGKALRASVRVWEPFEETTKRIEFENDLAEALFLDFSLYLADNLLVKIDRASMASSLELRTPFLDHGLVEFAARLPADLKVRHLQLKYLFKKAVEPWLPRAIVYRQKRGFSVPVARLLRYELQPLLNEMLAEDRLKQEGLFNPSFVHGLMAEHRQGRADHRKTLWALLMFELWRERWGKR